MSLNGNKFTSSFDCSHYLGHGIKLSFNAEGYQWERNPTEFMDYADDYPTKMGEHDYSFSASKLKQFELADSCRISSAGDYYPLEYSNLLSCIGQSNLDDIPMNENELNNILKISAIENALLAYMIRSDMSESVVNGDSIKSQERRRSVENLWSHNHEDELLENAYRYAEQVMKKCGYRYPFQYKNMVKEYLDGFGKKQGCNVDSDHLELSEEDQNRKRRLCRHFLKGHCKRGKTCDFLHDPSIFCPNSQKVFLGGLPAHITEVTLRQKLAQHGYQVLNKPKVLRGFTPQVCLGSVEEAQKLIEKRNILIDGSLVDVRPYEAFATGGMDESRSDDIKRSVFLGGLSKGTTSQMIKDDLNKLDVKVINHPIVKTGFTPKVTFGTVKESKMLIKLKKVRIKGTLVDVRPYTNFNSQCRVSKKKKRNKAD